MEMAFSWFLETIISNKLFTILLDTMDMNGRRLYQPQSSESTVLSYGTTYSRKNADEKCNTIRQIRFIVIIIF
jgi:hypothetical protein